MLYSTPETESDSFAVVTGAFRILKLQLDVQSEWMPIIKKKLGFCFSLDKTCSLACQILVSKLFTTSPLSESFLWRMMS